MCQTPLRHLFPIWKQSRSASCRRLIFMTFYAACSECPANKFYLWALGNLQTLIQAPFLIPGERTGRGTNAGVWQEKRFLSQAGPKWSKETRSHGGVFFSSAIEFLISSSVWLPSFTHRPHAPKRTMLIPPRTHWLAHLHPTLCLSWFSCCFLEDWGLPPWLTSLRAPGRQGSHLGSFFFHCS